MKQVLQDFRSGTLTVEEVPAPPVRPGCVLVANHYSLISSGTEGGTVRLGRMNWLQKARARPEQVRKVLNVVRTDGLATAVTAVRRTLEVPLELGYCSAGQVLAVGEGVSTEGPDTRFPPPAASRASAGPGLGGASARSVDRAGGAPSEPTPTGPGSRLPRRNGTAPASSTSQSQVGQVVSNCSVPRAIMRVFL